MDTDGNLYGNRCPNLETVVGRAMLLPTPLSVEREHPERVEALKAAGATQINSRANGEQRPNGLMDFMQFYDLLPTPVTTDYNMTLSEDAKEECLRRREEEGKTTYPSKLNQLRQLAADWLLPTPRANKVNDCDLNNPTLAERNKSNLEEEVA